MRTIELDQIVHRYGDVSALDGIDLRIEAGESVAVLGPSGCGKSTLLRLLAGLDTPTAGDIRFDGDSQLRKLPHQRDVGIVFQSYALYPHLSARGNIALGLRHGLKLSAKETAARVAEEAARLEITELLDRKPAKMSGGQRQRVALARALAKRSGIVLLDEPLSGLDAQLRTSLRVEIAGLIRSIRATTLHVTHDQVDALTMADRVVLLRDGKIQQIGTPLELYRNPTSWFVAGFIGTPTMNGLPCRVDSGQVIATGFGVLGDCDEDATIAGVRAEDVQIGGAGPLRADAVVSAVELHGADWLIHTEIGEVRIAVRHQGTPPAVASRVALCADLSSFHLFAPDGRRIGQPTPTRTREVARS